MEKLELTVDFKTTSGMFDKDVYIEDITSCGIISQKILDYIS